MAGLHHPSQDRHHLAASITEHQRRGGKGWGQVFGDQVVATAILNRLLHHSHGLTIRGDSYRLREKRRSGLIRPQTGGCSSAPHQVGQFSCRQRTKSGCRLTRGGSRSRTAASTRCGSSRRWPESPAGARWRCSPKSTPSQASRRRSPGGGLRGRSDGDLLGPQWLSVPAPRDGRTSLHPPPFSSRQTLPSFIPLSFPTHGGAPQHP